MKNLKFFLIVLLLSCLSGCEEKECCFLDEIIGHENLPGTWLLVETGYSPGAGYIIEEVPSEPPQTLTFREDGTLTSTNLLSDFKYYRVSTDTVHGGEIVAFYKDNPQQPLDPSDRPPTYSLDIENNRLTLSYRWCFEGCHMKFKPVRSERETKLSPPFFKEGTVMRPQAS